MAKLPAYEDLIKFKHSDLTDLQRALTKALAESEAKAKNDAKAAIAAAAAEYGFSVAELFADGGKGKAKGRGSVTPKYVHPENAALTWTGRGRKPLWLREQIDAGKQLEDFAI